MSRRDREHAYDDAAARQWVQRLAIEPSISYGEVILPSGNICLD